MADLADGESVEVKGSAAKPYVIKNTGGVYSCSCPAWRNQSIAIEQRTCKHIRKIRGDDAENERIGSVLPQKPAKASTSTAEGEEHAVSTEPPILLAESWDNALDLAGWWISEKLDGVRAYWDGQQFISRQGNLYHAPDWFIEGLPATPLDGELWLDRKAFQRTVSIVRRQDKNDQWKSIRYVVFDAPSQAGRFEERLEFLKDGASAWKNEFLQIHQQELCRDVGQLREELRRIESLGGEGLMLREPGSLYVAGRSTTLLKVKTFHDAEAVVIGHEPGKGRHAGRLGALVAQLPNGKQFSVGTGFSDRQRESPPAIGSLIQFRYQELSDAGIPRFPSYVGIRTDIDLGSATPTTAEPVKKQSAEVIKVPAARAKGLATSKPEKTVAAASTPAAPPVVPGGLRLFEFVEGASSKFWEISLAGSDVTTRWGRIGTDGQSKTKPFGSPEKARAEYDKLVAEKTGKGYVEVGGSAAPEGLVETSLRVLEMEQLDRTQDDEDLGDVLNTVAVAFGDTKESDGIEGSLCGALSQMRELLNQLPGGRTRNRLDEMLSELDDSPPSAPQPTIPAEIHLQSDPAGGFENEQAVAALTKQIRKAGFSLVGDFTIQELPVRLRAFIRGTDTYAVINEFGPHQWVELCVINADDTYENWSNVPSHDGRVPPWSTVVRDSNADFNQLHALLVEGRSDKAPASLTAADFAAYFERAYARGMEWRTKPQTEHAIATQQTSQTTSGASATSGGSNSTELAAQRPIVLKEYEDKVWDYAREYKKSPAGHAKHGRPDVVPAGKALLAMSPSEQVEIVKACLKLHEPVIDSLRYDVLMELRESLLRRKLPYSNADVAYLALDLKSKAAGFDGIDKFLLGALEQWCKSNTLPAEARESLRFARDNAYEGFGASGGDKLKARIDELIGEKALRIPIVESEVWAVTAVQDIKQMDPAKQRLWTELLQCCVSATDSKPASKWLNSVKPLVDSLTKDEFLAIANKWFPLVEKPWTEKKTFGYGHPLQIMEVNQFILRGLVWCCSLAEDRDTTRTLGALARSVYRTVPMQGPRSQKVGNACVFTLGAMELPDAVTQLAVLKVKVKNGTAQRFIEGELNKAAERLGIARDELEEMSVPAYGLEEVGLRREELGEFTAELTVDSKGETELKWLKPDGTPQKSVPAKVQQDFDEELKDLKAAAKDIQKMVTVQRERIDGLFLQQKQWPLEAWRERYLNHPLVGIIARRLVWVFRNGPTEIAGAFLNGQLIDRWNQPVEGINDQTTVELWHPIDRAEEEVTAWRAWLEEHSIQQPFKQAHREVYVLTDAERQTGTYSNRFAAHILKQTQLRALASARGWHAKLLGYWDGGGDAQIYRYLPRWNITAQYWVNGIYPEEGADVNSDIPEGAGLALVSTDQVRFYSGEYREYAPDDDVMALSDVPPLVLSEIMRDVDLFVGVSSLGNDPNWHDGGQGGHYRDYWTGYSFGTLSESAKTRREVLQRLIPRLKIAGRCTFEDRFLIVRGDLRTYRIHFGSGNIQMEPNDQYLCIVPKPGAGEEVFLPFEGDRTLSIILSKALMLADDKKIKDPTILSQIQLR